MTFKEIVGKIYLLNDIPVFYRNELKCSTITYDKPGEKKEKGIYLPDGNIDDLYEFNCAVSPVEFKFYRSIIEVRFIFNPYTYAVFNILHELGHWTQYTDFIGKGHSDLEFCICFELDRKMLFIDREKERRKLTAKGLKDFNEKYSERYLTLNTEIYANNFAANHMDLYCKEWKKEDIAV